MNRRSLLLGLTLLPVGVGSIGVSDKYSMDLRGCYGIDLPTFLKNHHGTEIRIEKIVVNDVINFYLRTNDVRDPVYRTIVSTKTGYTQGWFMQCKHYPNSEHLSSYQDSWIKNGKFNWELASK